MISTRDDWIKRSSTPGTAISQGERGVAYSTRLGQIEVMRWTDGVGDYDAWTREATKVELEPGLDVQVGSASHLLLSKEHAGREKDTDALPLIRAELLASGSLQASDVRGPVASLPTEVTPDSRVEQILGPDPDGPAAHVVCGITAHS